MSNQDDLKQALDQYAAQLSRLPNVQGCGISNRERNGKMTNELAVIVYITKKIPELNLASEALIPNKLTINDAEGREKDVPVDVQEVGLLSPSDLGRRQ